MKLISYFVAGLLLTQLSSWAQTAIKTSFESPIYTAGSINSQNSWTVVGNAAISATKAKTGTNGLSFNNASSALLVNYNAYGGSVTGIRDVFYTDMWVNPVSFATKGIQIIAYDQYASNAKRIYAIELTVDKKIKVSTGSSSTDTELGTWIQDDWFRLSIKTDLVLGKFKVAINGVLNPAEFSLREAYTPTASMGRAATIKEFHSLRINHTSDTQVASSNFTVDDLYIGKNPIPDISFLASPTARIINVEQPSYGSISLNPAQASYQVNDQVTATLTLPQGYLNNGWTGDLSGTELTKTFNITNNMVVGANVTVDNTAPPAEYTVAVTQPANATITLSPAPTNGKYLSETTVTATVNVASCYQFNGWTGNLSGTQVSKTFAVSGDMSIGAEIAINTTPGITRNVTTVTEFKAALAAMNPGDIISVEDGSYDLSSLTVNRSACPNRPIVIKAKNQGQAILNGATALVLDGLQYVTLQGFSFRSANVGTGIKMLNCSRVRITRNSFKLDETNINSCNWLYIGDTFGSTAPLKSGHNRVDYNLFEGKTKSGKFILLDGNINQQTQYDTIAYNVFRNNGPREENEKETIRIGVSTLSQSNGYTVVEYNLFEDCDGDPEIVSVKSFANTVRYNTFRRCLGTVCLRQGNNSIVEGNYFFGEGKTAIYTNENGNSSTIGAGGVRVYGKGHKIFNNYFSGLTGSIFDAAITITNGDAYNVANPTDLAKHYVPENLEVVFNTFVNNKSNIEIGYKYDKAPINCLIANNIVKENATQIIKSYSAESLAGVNFSNNIMYPTGTSTIGISAANTQIQNIDPLLEQPVCNGSGCEQQKAYEVLRLSASSPAINASTGNFSYAATDYEKQSRVGLADIGADEYDRNNMVQVSALDESNVGPNAVAFNYSYFDVLPITLVSFDAAYRNQQVELKWNVAKQENVKRYEVEWRTDFSDFKAVADLSPVQGQLNYIAKHSSPIVGNNYYRLKTVDENGDVDFFEEKAVRVLSSQLAKLYPNPAIKAFTVDFGYTATGSVKVKMVSVLGSSVYEQVVSGVSSCQIPVSTLAQGMYFVQFINAEKKMVSLPVIVSH
ncbi:chondroitinase-B domain-containing protein [Pedobacter xixiisoli]|uniref:Por secretion system C-terminal sorting domain-containing protein n=1 Tax=Pedobacter xixiisoli TaxID=1476464 RepID=A0A286AEJ6_9SPHI|nr:chondroitinase-B domain-containing protein [Pedobacter xixiisoli]SOD20323.1 Por secretion system C-terminal sorting domain-containing protein [Pedobacter xixiisoli]